MPRRGRRRRPRHPVRGHSSAPRAARREIAQTCCSPLAAQPSLRLIAGDLRSQFGIKGADFAEQQHEMQQYTGVHDQRDERPQYEGGLERQFDIEKRQFDRVFERQVAMRDSSGGNGKVKQDKQIAEPQSGADAAASTTGSRSVPKSFALAVNGVGSVLCGSGSRFRLVNMRRPS